MKDYIDILLESLSETCLSALSYEYFLQQKRERLASEALSRSLSKDQQALFLSYEEEHNASASMRMDALARQAFLLAREIYH